MVRVRVVVLMLTAAVIACSPSPTPSPAPTITVDAAAKAYSSFSAAWVGTYNARLNADSAAADADLNNVGRYAQTLAEAYGAFAAGVRGIAFPNELGPLVQQELEAVDVLVVLARQLEQTPTNIAVKTQLQDAIARVGQRSGAVEAALGVSH